MPEAAPIGAELRASIPYIESVAVDNLYAIGVQLASALWVVTERLQTVEALLAEKGLVARAEVETYRVPDALEPQRQADRNKFVADIFRSLRDNPG